MATLCQEEEVIDMKHQLFNGQIEAVLKTVPFHSSIKLLLKMMLQLNSERRPSFTELVPVFKRLFDDTGLLAKEEDVEEEFDPHVADFPAPVCSGFSPIKGS